MPRATSRRWFWSLLPVEFFTHRKYTLSDALCKYAGGEKKAFDPCIRIISLAYQAASATVKSGTGKFLDQLVIIPKQMAITDSRGWGLFFSLYKLNIMLKNFIRHSFSSALTIKCSQKRGLRHSIPYLKISHKKVHFCDLLYLWATHCKGPKPSPLQIPSLPNKLPTEADSRHGREQTHHDWAQTTVVCCRKGRVCMPVSHFLAQNERREAWLPKALHKNLHATFLLPSPAAGSLPVVTVWRWE